MIVEISEIFIKLNCTCSGRDFLRYSIVNFAYICTLLKKISKQSD